MRGGKGEQKSSETLGLLNLFSVCKHWVTVLFKKSLWKMLQHFLFFAKTSFGRGPPIIYKLRVWLPGGLAHRRVGSKASWQIALIPHGCAYTQVVASGVVKHIL